MVAGGAGSSKSGVTAERARAILGDDHFYVNTDDIRTMAPEFPALMGGRDVTDEERAAGMKPSPAQGSSVTALHEEAGHIRDQVLETARQNGFNVVLDAPGSKSVAGIMEEFHNAGYRVDLIYVHKPIGEALEACRTRAYTTTNPADLRPLTDNIPIGSHDKARGAFADMSAHAH